MRELESSPEKISNAVPDRIPLGLGRTIGLWSSGTIVGLASVCLTGPAIGLGW